MSFSDDMEAKILDYIFGATAISLATNHYIALTASDPSDDASGMSSEPTIGVNAYARVNKTNNTTTWASATGTSPTSKLNGEDFTFPTATGAWGTLDYFAILRSSTGVAGTDLIAHGALDVQRSPVNGDTVRFATGQLEVTLS